MSTELESRNPEIDLTLTAGAGNSTDNSVLHVGYSRHPFFNPNAENTSETNPEDWFGGFKVSRETNEGVREARGLGELLLILNSNQIRKLALDLIEFDNKTYKKKKEVV